MEKTSVYGKRKIYYETNYDSELSVQSMVCNCNDSSESSDSK